MVEWELECCWDVVRVWLIFKCCVRRRDEWYDEWEDVDGDDCCVREFGGEYGGVGIYCVGGVKVRGLSAESCLEL